MQQRIKLLDLGLINQIAAGEVIERPAAAVKELVENSIDAGATKIEVSLRDGGRTLIQVIDNGYGMNPEDLTLCVERHATSKLNTGDLFNIHSFGFRGEALPSIGSVSRLSIISKPQGQETAFQLDVEGGVKSDLTPASYPFGTRVVIRDLFYATPARLKFLKSPTTELGHSTDYLNRLALAHPSIEFTLKEGSRVVFHYPSCATFPERLKAVLGREFSENSRQVTAIRDHMEINGWISLPTYNSSQSTEQYLFVNDRPIKDKSLSAAIRVAYQDFLPSNRYPSLAVFLKIDPSEVDVNVHPAKAEVRFREAQVIRGLFISALKQTLHETTHETSAHLARDAVAILRDSSTQAGIVKKNYPAAFSAAQSIPLQGRISSVYGSGNYQARAFIDEAASIVNESFQDETEEDLYPLGLAKAQLHKTYIIAEKNDSLVIVDQHAAHERLVYEKMKEQYQENKIRSQTLLLPEIINLTENDIHLLTPYLEELERLGIGIEVFGTNSLVIRQIPALLSGVDVASMIKDLIADLKELGTSYSLTEKLHEVLSTLACHSSIRAGKTMSIPEMNALLRQMENTPHSGQCNHGRPTYIELQKDDIEKLFGRR
ncbi:MAG: DNA mismatch repair endonuclease MutL [Alphaproteobacteria bacterium]|nr:DNA mismatch repair endonuclease MutL [Alphaproteobacteria bacterium]